MFNDFTDSDEAELAAAFDVYEDGFTFNEREEYDDIEELNAEQLELADAVREDFEAIVDALDDDDQWSYSTDEDEW